MKSPRFRWTEEEQDFLESLVGEWPFVMVVKKYNEKARQENWPSRTERAIAHRINGVAGMSRRAASRNFNCAEISKILGVADATPRQWAKKKKLFCYRVGGQTMITDRQIGSLARKHPELLKNARWEGLVFLFGEEEARKIRECKVPRRTLRSPRPVVHLPTGKVYSSLVEASKNTYRHHNTVRSQADRGEEFRWATKEDLRRLSQ